MRRRICRCAMRVRERTRDAALSAVRGRCTARLAKKIRQIRAMPATAKICVPTAEEKSVQMRHVSAAVPSHERQTRDARSQARRLMSAFTRRERQSDAPYLSELCSRRSRVPTRFSFSPEPCRRARHGLFARVCDATSPRHAPRPRAHLLAHVFVARAAALQRFNDTKRRASRTREECSEDASEARHVSCAFAICRRAAEARGKRCGRQLMCADAPFFRRRPPAAPTPDHNRRCRAAQSPRRKQQPIMRIREN